MEVQALSMDMTMERRRMIGDVVMVELRSTAHGPAMTTVLTRLRHLLRLARLGAAQVVTLMKDLGTLALLELMLTTDVAVDLPGARLPAAVVSEVVEGLLAEVPVAATASATR